MESFGMKLMRRVCRFIAAILWQLVWLVPVCGLCWYGKLVLPQMVRAQFGIDQTQDRLLSLEPFAEIMKHNTSFSNPTALLHYVSAQLSKISVSMKLNTLEASSEIFQTVCIWLINILWIVAVIYAVIRVFKTYRSKSKEYALAQRVARQIQPDIWALQREVMVLREEIQSLKKLSELLIEAKAEEQPLLPHE